VTQAPALAPIAPKPPPAARTPRERSIHDAARRLLETEGADALSMRRLADELGIKAPSLYKHLSGKDQVELLLTEEALAEMGDATHAAVRRPGTRGPVAALLATYRRYAVAHPHLYRLVTGPGLPRDRLPAGLEEWAGEPFYLAAGEPHLAQSLWAYAHGMVVLEIDHRFLPGSDLDRTWQAGAAAYTAARPS